jgi:hypothetical protein
MDITNRSDVNSLAEAQSNTANSLLENCKTADSSHVLAAQARLRAARNDKRA